METDRRWSSLRSRHEPREFDHYQIEGLSEWIIKEEANKAFTTPQAAKVLGMTMGGLRHMRNRGDGPRCRQYKNAWVYEIKDVEAFKKYQDAVRKNK